MGFRNKGLVLAMEEEGLLPEEEVVETEPEIVPAEVEQEVAEVQEEGTEVDDLNTAIEEAIADAETVEDTTEVMEDSVDEGGEGIDEAGAQIAEIAVESLCRRLGIHKKVMPALESFKSPSSRVTATRVAIEGWKDVAKKAWEAIKLAFAKMWENLIAFMENLFNVNERIKKAAEEGLGKIKAMDGKTPAAQEFESASIAAAFGFATKASGETTVKILETGSKAMRDFIDCANYFEGCMKSIGEMVGTFKAVSGSQNQSGEINTKLQAELTKAVKGISDTLDFKDDDGEQLIGVFVGGKTLTAIISDGGNSLSVGEDQAGGSDSKVVATLKQDEAKKILEAVIASCNAGIELKSKKALFMNFKKTADDTISKAIVAAGKMEGADDEADETKKAFEKCRKATTAFGNSFARLGQKVPTLAIKGSKMALNYVEASLKQYKAEAEKPAAAEPAAA